MKALLIAFLIVLLSSLLIHRTIAQTYNNNIQPEIPDASVNPVANNELVTYTTRLANALIKACPWGNESSIGYVNFLDKGCQNTLRQSRAGTFEDRVIDQFQNMPLQSLMFIYGISLHFNKPIELHLAGKEAHAQQNYDFIPASEGIGQLQPGDFIVWNDYGPGHIAEVVAVNPVTNSITVIDANWDNKGSIWKHEVAFAPNTGNVTMAGWLRMKR